MDPDVIDNLLEQAFPKPPPNSLHQKSSGPESYDGEKNDRKPGPQVRPLTNSKKPPPDEASTSRKKHRPESPPSRYSRHEHERYTRNYYREDKYRNKGDHYSPSHRSSHNLKQRPKSPLTSKEQRDRMTVFVNRLPITYNEQKLHSFFSPIGKIRSIQSVQNKNSTRPKGCCYIEFNSEQDAQKALTLSGQKLDGHPLTIEMSEAEKNFLAEEMAEAVKQSLMRERCFTKIIVGNLHSSICEPDVRMLFEPFGKIECIEVVRETSSKVYAVIEFQREEAARHSKDVMNNFELVGMRMKIGSIIKDRKDVEFPKEQTMHSAKLERTQMMMKLSRDQRVNSRVPIGRFEGLSACLYLRGLYDPEEEETIEWADEIEKEIYNECSRFGHVMKIWVMKTAQGEAYVRMENPKEGEAVYSALNGRWFTNRQISCSFISLEKYKVMFPN